SSSLPMTMPSGLCAISSSPATLSSLKEAVRPTWRRSLKEWLPEKPRPSEKRLRPSGGWRPAVFPLQTEHRRRLRFSESPQRFSVHHFSGRCRRRYRVPPLAHFWKLGHSQAHFPQTRPADPHERRGSQTLRVAWREGRDADDGRRFAPRCSRRLVRALGAPGQFCRLAASVYDRLLRCPRILG